MSRSQHTQKDVPLEGSLEGFLLNPRAQSPRIKQYQLGSYKKDPSILGSILRSQYLGKLPPERHTPKPAQGAQSSSAPAGFGGGM